MKSQRTSYGAIIGWTVLTVCSVAFALLADGMAGGKVSSLGGFAHDVLSANPAVFLRLLFWLMILGPLFGLASAVAKKIKTPRSP